MSRVTEYSFSSFNLVKVCGPLNISSFEPLLLLHFIDYILVDSVSNFIYHGDDCINIPKYLGIIEQKSMMLHVNSFTEPLASFASRAEFHFYTRLLNKPSRANLLVQA
jgi:hypothetical protein